MPKNHPSHRETEKSCTRLRQPPAHNAHENAVVTQRRPCRCIEFRPRPLASNPAAKINSRARCGVDVVMAGRFGARRISVPVGPRRFCVAPTIVATSTAYLQYATRMSRAQHVGTESEVQFEGHRQRYLVCMMTANESDHDQALNIRSVGDLQCERPQQTLPYELARVASCLCVRRHERLVRHRCGSTMSASHHP